MIYPLPDFALRNLEPAHIRKYESDKTNWHCRRRRTDTSCFFLLSPFGQLRAVYKYPHGTFINLHNLASPSTLLFLPSNNTSTTLSKLAKINFSGASFPHLGLRNLAVQSKTTGAHGRSPVVRYVFPVFVYSTPMSDDTTPAGPTSPKSSSVHHVHVHHSRK